jgi:hypothetical protein
MNEDPRAEASAEIFRRYLALLDGCTHDPLEAHPRLSIANLVWICEQGVAQAHVLPLDKISRWLGFVQGCLAMRGLSDVDVERDETRPIFHRAYERCGIIPPEPQAKDAGRPEPRQDI